MPERAPVERLLDAAMVVPKCTAAAALITARLSLRLAARAASQIAVLSLDLLTHDQAAIPLPGTHDGDDSDRATPVTETGQHAATQRAADSSNRTDSDELPVEGYDHLAARQVVGLLAGLSASELAMVEEYERAHRNRQTILARIAQLRNV